MIAEGDYTLVFVYFWNLNEPVTAAAEQRTPLHYVEDCGQSPYSACLGVTSALCFPPSLLQSSFCSSQHWQVLSISFLSLSLFG